MRRSLRSISLAGLMLILCAVPATAESFNVYLDTSTLASPTYLLFGFTDGDGVQDNAVLLSNFSFGGGAASGPPDFLGTLGGAGDTATSIVLTDSSFSALFLQLFQPGSDLRFQMTITHNFAPGGFAPDAFAMSLYDENFNAISNDQFTGALLILDITGQPIHPSSFNLTGADDYALPPPLVTPVPEPATLLLLAAGCTGLLRRRLAR